MDVRGALKNAHRRIPLLGAGFIESVGEHLEHGERKQIGWTWPEAKAHGAERTVDIARTLTF